MFEAGRVETSFGVPVSGGDKVLFALVSANVGDTPCRRRDFESDADRINFAHSAPNSLLGSLIRHFHSKFFDRFFEYFSTNKNF